MKSYNGLFERMLETDEIKASIYEAAKKKKQKSAVLRVTSDIDNYSKNLRDKILHDEWQPCEHEEHILREGYHKKARNILKPRWDNEQIVHHMLMRQLIPILQPKIYTYACGSIKGKGAHFLLRNAKRWVKMYKGKRFYVVEMDIHKFYDNVSHAILKQKLERLIRDRRYTNLLMKSIGSGETGIAKGFYTSPWLAHLYLMGMDSYIVQELRPDHYERYVDNIWLFGRNKRALRDKVMKLEAYVAENLGLEFNTNTQIYRFENSKGEKGRAINLVGFVVHRGHIGIRKGILKRVRAKANRMNRHHRCTIKDATSVVSRMGYFRWSDAHEYFAKWIRPKVSIRYCKRRIAKHAKEMIHNDRLVQERIRLCAGSA